MPLVSRLRDLLQDLVEPDAASPDHDLRLTVAALLTLIMRVDGRVLPVEEDGLKTLLGSRFGLSEDGAERLLGHLDEIEGSDDPGANLVHRIQHEVAPEDRPILLAMAYRVAAIDGYVHEFEDDLVWRIGRLLGFDDAAVTAIREDALRSLAPERARRA